MNPHEKIMVKKHNSKYSHIKAYKKGLDETISVVRKNFLKINRVLKMGFFLNLSKHLELSIFDLLNAKNEFFGRFHIIK